MREFAAQVKVAFSIAKLDVKAHTEWRTILKLLKQQAYFYKAEALLST